MFVWTMRGASCVALAAALSGVLVHAGARPATTNATTRSSPMDAAGWVRAGDDFYARAGEDVENVRNAREAWDQALVLDPQNRAALDRMLKFWLDVADMDSGNREVFTQLRATALKILEIDPNNEKAAVAMPTSIIRPWLAGAEQQEEEINTAISKLAGLSLKFPANPDVALFSAQAKLKLAERRRGEGKPAEAKRLSEEADQMIEAALARAPTAANYFAAAQVAQLKEKLDPALAQGQREKAVKLYADAMRSVEADDPLLAPIYIGASRANAGTPQAEAILRELLKRKPDDPQARLALAEELAATPSKKAEALPLLDQPIPPGRLIGAKAYVARELKMRMAAMSANVRMDLAHRATDAKERAEFLAAAEQKILFIEKQEGVSARALRLRGKLLRMEGKTIEAIKTLENAKALYDKQTQTASERLDRWEVVDLLAKAYIETNQIGRGKQLLSEMLERFPTYDPARMLLITLLIREGNVAEARPHIEYFDKRKPNDPEVIKMKLWLLSKSGQAKPGDADELAKLPEATIPQILDKVNSAMVMKQTDEAKRLLEKAKTLSPGSFDVARMGVRVYRALDDLEACRRIADDALAANPTDENLRKLQLAVQRLRAAPAPPSTTTAPK